MKNDDFEALVKATIERTGQLLIAKGAEYSDHADRLANFKRNAEKNGQTILECWQIYWGKHIDSINSYMLRVKDEAVKHAICIEITEARRQGEEGFSYLPDPKRFRENIDKSLGYALKEVEAKLSEPIEGRFDDNINYSILCQAILKELRQ